MEGDVALSVWEFAALVAAAARGDGLGWLRREIQDRLGGRKADSGAD